MNKLLSAGIPLAVLLLGMLIGFSGCHKSVTPPDPAISSFTLASATMTSATFSFSASHYQNLSLNVNGVTADVSSSSATVNNLKANTKYTAELTATNGEKSISQSLNFTTSQSNLKVDSLSVTNIGVNTITLAFASSSDASITTETLVNETASTTFNVLGKASQVVSDLKPNTSYTFVYRVDDASGNEKADTLTVSTLPKASDWFSVTSVSIAKTFAMDPNAQSAEMTIKLENLSSATATLPKLVANFGANAKAVKMLRFQLNGESPSTHSVNDWYVLTPDDSGNITFWNLSLNPGANTITAYFAVRPDYGGVPNDASLSFAFTTLDDGTGASWPHGGSFPSAVNLGTVNTTVEPTEINGGLGKKIEIAPFYGNIIRSSISDNPNGNFDQSSIFAFGFTATGPAGARLYSLRIENPWWPFTALVFDPNRWFVASFYASTSKASKVNNSVWESQNKAITFTFVNDGNSQVFVDGKTISEYIMTAGFKNDSTVDFDSANFNQPSNQHQWTLASKYDIVIVDANGQTVDLSDVSLYVVK